MKETCKKIIRRSVAVFTNMKVKFPTDKVGKIIIIINTNATGWSESAKTPSHLETIT